MAEGHSSEIEGKRGPVTRIKDILRSNSWAKEIARQHESTVEQVGDITESLGIVPVFLDDRAKKEMLTHWQGHGGNEVGGWAVGTEGEHDAHKYLHVTKIIPDTGSGSQGEFHFGDPHGAYEYIRQRRKEGERLVVIGTVHTHPKGWSGRITGQGRDSTVFSTYEATKGGDLMSSKSSHIIITPADDNRVDIWQAKETSETWEKRLIRTGHFLLTSNNKPVSRVRVVDSSPPSRVRVVDKPSRVRVKD